MKLRKKISERKRVIAAAGSRRKSAQTNKTMKGYFPTHMIAAPYLKVNNRLILKAEVTKHTGIVFGRNIGNPWLPIAAGVKRKNVRTKPSYPGAEVGPEFYAVTFPPGWRIRGNHKQYQLLDAQNCMRGKGHYLPHIFAILEFYCFYRIRNVDETAVIFDGKEKEIKRFRNVSNKPGKEKLFVQARIWLKANYPDCDNIWAYW